MLEYEVAQTLVCNTDDDSEWVIQPSRLNSFNMKEEVLTPELTLVVIDLKFSIQTIYFFVSTRKLIQFMMHHLLTVHLSKYFPSLEGTGGSQLVQLLTLASHWSWVSMSTRCCALSNFY